ncbi:pseudouridine synthase [Shewanella colwelliana]|uniref:Pseudouridine synthase n=1 Tax=Shewanella colwelliana TaxID=23 RepID=A0A1E5IRW9_SHECO|nr:pseudouridine synthase [Shewanella colwelliana]MDX1280056.1 pseudouridine synthase [Shewanella colwelliana]OEG73315.1 pseudouridine synthase [Shewanella colwelliana]GIU38943.1 RNA pseudouridylate synthase [Shewanella colwelliana]
MVRAAQASHIVLPENLTQHKTVLSFLAARFPQIPLSTWKSRMAQGNVHWQDASRITPESPYVGKQKVFYYREVVQESKVPFDEEVLYEDAQIIIAYKPHFLALHPSGNFVNECLVNRLRIKTGNPNLVPAHRLDRATAGIVILIKNQCDRDAYHALFRDGHITKTYQAVASLTPELQQQLALSTPAEWPNWTVKNRLVKGSPSLMMAIAPGIANAHSEIRLIGIEGTLGRFELSPVTGKTHQLRVHMNSLSMPILNDTLYPQLLPKADDNFEKPLKLLAKGIIFRDPVSHRDIDIQLEDLSF